MNNAEIGNAMVIKLDAVLPGIQHLKKVSEELRKEN